MSELKQGEASQAFPIAEAFGNNGERSCWFDPGLNQRQYAAIHLRVADSGTDWLDKMIRAANFDALVAQLAQSRLPTVHGDEANRTFAYRCRQLAGALMEVK